ncbi:MAG: hypothetical protein ACRENS_11070 [Candidatus Eiseniibacteriota bacterium]
MTAALALAWPGVARARPASRLDAFGADSLGTSQIAMAAPARATPQVAVSVTGPRDQSTAEQQRLPFADNPIPSTYPKCSFSIGYGGYLSEFQGVMSAFRAAEDFARTGGYPVPTAAEVNPEGAILADLHVSINPLIEIALQYDHTNNNNDDLQLLGALLSARHAFPEIEKLSVLGGVGGGAYGFRFERRYDVQITAVDTNGGYNTLDYIKFEGGGGYWTMAGRLEYRMAPWSSAAGTVQYFGMRDVSASEGGVGPFSINVSGTMVGASLRIHF